MLPENKKLELPKDYQGYCPALWKEVYVNTRGDIGPCCVWQDVNWSGYGWKEDEPLPPRGSGWKEENNNTKTIGSALQNTRYLQRQRQTVLNKKIPKGCAYCVKQEEMGISSQRKQLIEKLGPLDDKILESTEVSDDEIEYLDIRPGNTCNYMCNFCGPQASHLIGKEWQKSDALGETDFGNIENKETPWHYKVKKSLTFNSSQVKMEFVDSFSKYKNLKFVHVAGGEPFHMKKELRQIIDCIPNKDKVTMRVITNLSLYDDAIMESLSEFKKIHFLLSVDGVGRAIEISRWKSDWNNIQSNIKKYIAYGRRHNQFKTHMVPAISVYTLLTLPRLLQYGHDNKIEADVLFVQDPIQQRINLLPTHVLQNIKDKIEHLYLTGDITERFCNYKEIIQQLTYYIENNKIKNETIESFWHWQSYWEKNRNYSLKEELPELYPLIKTV